MQENAIALREQKSFVSDIMSFVVAQFEVVRRPVVPEQVVKGILSLMHDWITKDYGTPYLYELLGIEITGLNNCVIHSENHYGYDRNPDDVDVEGVGFYIYEKKKESDYVERMRSHGELNRYEAKAINSWIEARVDKDLAKILYSMNPKDLELICWCYLMYAISPEGNDFLYTIDPWYEEVESSMDRYSLDRNTKPFKWNRNQCPGQIGGIAVAMAWGEVYGDYGCEYIEPEELAADGSNLEQIERVERINNTGYEIIDPETLTITGRTLNECRYCGAILRCVYLTQKINPPAEFASYEYTAEHRICRHCVGAAEKDGIIFNETMSCYTEKCPYLFLQKLVETDMGVEESKKIVIEGIKNMAFGYNGSPIPNDRYLAERVNMLAKSEPNRIRHMAAYILMKNGCLAERWSDEQSCGRLNYKAINRWFLTLRQADYEERIRLGTYTEKVRQLV